MNQSFNRSCRVQICRYEQLAYPLFRFLDSYVDYRQDAYQLKVPGITLLSYRRPSYVSHPAVIPDPTTNIDSYRTGPHIITVIISLGLPFHVVACQSVRILLSKGNRLHTLVWVSILDLFVSSQYQIDGRSKLPTKLNKIRIVSGWQLPGKQLWPLKPWYPNHLWRGNHLS